MELRHRGNRSDNNQQMETFQIDEKSSNTKDEAIRNQKCLSAVPTLLVSLAVLIILNVFVYYMDNKLPSTESNNSTSNDFVAKRAMSTLIKLANLGPRPVGSYENEKLAFNLLKTEINDITNEVGNVNDIEVYNQKVSGSFILNMKNWKYLLSYEDLQNIVVKICINKNSLILIYILKLIIAYSLIEYLNAELSNLFYGGPKLRYALASRAKIFRGIDRLRN